MSYSFDVLWLSASPSLKYFDQPLLRNLSKYLNVARWEYRQTKDEASSIDKAVALLSDCLKSCDRPVHLVGHGISGIVGLMFARQYPQQVQSLTLLAVAAQPATTWHTHYYIQRQLLPITREQVLVNTVRSLFGNKHDYSTKKLAAALERDLEESPSVHSLFRLADLPKGDVSVPLMVCGSQTDPVVHPPVLHEWLTWLKPEDKIWECPAGYHFFHHFYPQLVGKQILHFWQLHHPQLLSKIVNS